ncbi:unnamed protein product, partial [Nesidiocoris tenuis]
MAGHLRHAVQSNRGVPLNFFSGEVEIEIALEDGLEPGKPSPRQFWLHGEKQRMELYFRQLRPKIRHQQLLSSITYL